MSDSVDKELRAIHDRMPETDAVGEVDLEQLRYNQSLSPSQRLAENSRWLAFVEIVREAGRKFYGNAR